MVLVADDDEGIRETSASILRGAGYNVVEAADGDAALVCLEQDDIDVAVLDVRMPFRDGISVVTDLVPHPPPPGVVISSAYALDADVRERLGDRIFRYLRKPVAPPDLIAMVAEAAEAVAALGGHHAGRRP